MRDIRVRGALEEAGRNAEHFARQPFGQVPWLTAGDISIFESGAILLHLGERSDALMPADTRSRCEALEWLFAALNSVEMARLFSGDTGNMPGWKRLDAFLKARLQRCLKNYRNTQKLKLTMVFLLVLIDSKLPSETSSKILLT